MLHYIQYDEVLTYLGICQDCMFLVAGVAECNKQYYITMYTLSPVLLQNMFLQNMYFPEVQS